MENIVRNNIFVACSEANGWFTCCLVCGTVVKRAATQLLLIFGLFVLLRECFFFSLPDYFNNSNAQQQDWCPKWKKSDDNMNNMHQTNNLFSKYTHMSEKFLLNWFCIHQAFQFILHMDDSCMCRSAKIHRYTWNTISEICDKKKQQPKQKHLYRM